jgi:hypothetical protein
MIMKAFTKTLFLSIAILTSCCMMAQPTQSTPAQAPGKGSVEPADSHDPFPTRKGMNTTVGKSNKVVGTTTAGDISPAPGTQNYLGTGPNGTSDPKHSYVPNGSTPVINDLKGAKKNKAAGGSNSTTNPK